MSEHTPGPFKAIKNDNGAIVCNEYGLCVAIVSCLAGQNEPPLPLDCQHRTADLLSAAPDMLAALKFTLRKLLDEAEARNYTPTTNPDVIAELEAAIAKAEGRA